jgi:hypothetical protein
MARCSLLSLTAREWKSTAPPACGKGVTTARHGLLLLLLLLLCGTTPVHPERHFANLRRAREPQRYPMTLLAELLPKVTLLPLVSALARE